MRYLGKAERARDLVVLIVLAISAASATSSFHLTFVSSTLLFFLLPLGYLFAFRDVRRNARKLATSFFCFGVLHGFVFAYIANLSGAWSWPVTGIWIQDTRILGVAPISDIIWVSLWFTYIVAFYEHFFERHVRDIMGPRIAIAYVFIVSFIVLISLSHAFAPGLFAWTYGYFWLAIFMLPPVAYLLMRRPRIFGKIMLPAVFFIPLHLLIEYVGLREGHWLFDGKYVGTVHLNGAGTLPLEEFFIWILAGSVIVLAYYEVFVDDMR